MKKLCTFAALVIFIMTSAFANSNDTINAGQVSYQATYEGKILHIAKDSAVVITGVDSIVKIAQDTAKHSEKVTIYVGKKKFNQWLKSGYTKTSDPSDTTGRKLIITAMGGDTNTISDPPLSTFYKFLIGLVIACFAFGSYRWLR